MGQHLHNAEKEGTPKVGGVGRLLGALGRVYINVICVVAFFYFCYFFGRRRELSSLSLT